MNKVVALFFCVILSSCLCVQEPHNPLHRDGTHSWWAADTSSMTSDNPWEIYVPLREKVPTDDPWSSFVAPELFPEGYRPTLDVEPERSMIQEGEVF